MILQLKRDVSELQHIIGRLQSEKTTLVHENISLSTKCDTLQTILVNIKSASSTSSIVSNSLESRLSPSDSASSSDEQKPILLDGFVREDYDNELNPQDYPLVRSWTKKSWLEQLPKNTTAKPGSSGQPSRGSRRMAQGINVSCQYLQDKKGITVTAQRAKTIRNIMLSSFRQLDSQGLAPASIGQVSLDVLNWLFHTLRRHCPELRLCVDNWKATKLMMDNYSQWYNYHVKKKGIKLVKHEDVASSCESITEGIQIESPAEPTQSNPTSKRATSLDTTDNEAEPARKKQCIEDLDTEDTQHKSDHSLPLTLQSTTPDTSHAMCDTQEKASESTSSLRHDKGKQKEIPSDVEIRSPLDGLIIEPKATSSSAYSATTLASKPSSSDTSLPTTAVPSPDLPSSNNDSCAPVVLRPTSSATNATSLALKKELVATDSELHKPEPPKKRQPSSKPMRVTANVTARNLCALDWQQNGNQTEPACVFAAYWNKLSNADKEAYKRKAAAACLNSSSSAQSVPGSD
ncbi:uncharacterized protein HD556DRAFT_1306860 [Suillus plorans]|uniref:Uncharacterized protein n=1 Tax=Suillus plorans TaxID=116603 RepID=A0A9P7AW99_9AGAM|nr:uncharacterized protein HD556DRAFT_1306860 [Suillus plorans]KAG1796664.1 hypothetical protein HD556DRAFT_1306860 [Suillus plorans]